MSSPVSLPMSVRSTSLLQQGHVASDDADTAIPTKESTAGVQSLTPSPLLSQSPSSSASPPVPASGAVDPDKLLRYFHSPHSHAVGSVHLACASCNPHGLKTSQPNSHLSVFKSNYISTTKYTVLNFLPRNLYEQFQKKANFYFLIIAILSFTPLSPKSPLPAVAPLVFVLAITAIKEALEDYKRHKVDVLINATLVSVWRYDTWVQVQWALVKAGDIVRVLSEHYFPADLVLLQSSSNQGACSIETANLDGETNLKVKQAVPATYELRCQQDDGCDYPSLFSAVLESDPPNDKMDQNSWNGNFHSLLNAAGETSKLPIALGFTQMLLRGCRLRNTKWIIGQVAFTGRDTKLMLQAKSKDAKRSQIDRLVDQCLYLIFLFQAVACTIGAVGQSIWLRRGGKSDTYYLKWSERLDISSYAFLSYFTYLVLMDILVPISLYVSMEMVKFAQAYLIDKDCKMRYESITEYGEVVVIPSQARTSNLNEELGQVAYIFSDKTGTLTRNEMKFLRCTIGMKEYGPGCMSDAGEVIPRQPFASSLPPPRPQYTFEDNRVLHDLMTPPHNKEDHLARAEMKAVDEYLTLLATCHTVMLSYDGCDLPHVHNVEQCGARTRFNAQSPDELALVEFAQEQQYFFHSIEPAKFQFEGRTIQGNRCSVNIMGVQHQFDVFEVIEFTSSRKRCSVILFDHRDEQVKLYCKGADNVIRERLTTDSLAVSWLPTNAYLQKFSTIGLRTLCCAYRVIPRAEFIAWYDQMQEAKSSMENRAEAVSQVSEIIEAGFTLLGTTAIEDRLQEGVPEAIASLALAGIKLWVLTGDKVETAINIGRSCKLLTDAMRGDQLLVLDIDESLSDADAMAETLDALSATEVSLARPGLNLDNVGIVVSGKALGFVFPRRKLNKKNHEIIPPKHVLEEERKLQMRFLAICTACKAVICCRMSPKQKSQVVRLVKDNLTDKITLAIGDGANDVAMIEAAHVGIGIEGLEGKQAVMASDYSIGQFRYLNRLLLVHGAWDYRRLSVLILYCFYKNITISLVQLWFGFQNGFSGQIFYDQISSSLYNISFTGLPILLVALFNRDISETTLLQFPQLYKAGQRNECFSTRMFCGVIAKGVVDSLLLFFVTTWAMRISGVSDGTEEDQWVAATALFTACVLVVNVQVGLSTRTWTVWNALSIVLMIVSWFVWIPILSSSPTGLPNTYGVATRLWKLPAFWLILPLLVAMSAVPDIAIKYYRDTYYPNTAALGTLYIPYLEAAAARDEEQQRKFAEASEAEGSRMDKLNRQSTVQTLTQNQADREAGGMGMSLAAATRLSTLGGQSSTDELSFQPSGAGSLVSAGGSATALSVVPISASPPAASASGRWNASGAGAFSLPTTGRPLSSRHTIGGMAPAMQRGGVGAQSLMSTLSEEDFQPNPMHSRSYSLGGGGAGEAQAHRAAQTWQQLAKTLKQDNVGFTPFAASSGESDYVMSGGRLRELSLAHHHKRTITIPHASGTDDSSSSSSAAPPPGHRHSSVGGLMQPSPESDSDES